MPKFDRDTVRDLVTSKDIKGLTFDTNVVESFARSGNLRHPMLRALAALNDKAVIIILSEVVTREARKHFVDTMMDAYRDAKASMNKLARVGGRTNESVTAAAAALPNEDEQEGSLDEEFTAFLGMLKAQVVQADKYAKFSEILDLYFDGKPPFANPNKKAEFPDAIAIASLQEWSEQEGAIIAVSNDGDWRAAFEASENVHVVSDLHTALAIFQEDDKLAATFAESFRKGDSDVLTALKNAIENSLDDLDVELDFSTDWQVEVELTEATVSSISAPADLIAPEIVGADAETLTLTVPVAAKINVVAHASFSVTDPIDKDEVTIGSHDISVDVDHDYLVTVTLYSHADGVIDIEEASVLPETRLSYVDLDYVGFSPGADYYE